ncbi:FAD/NAD(P)-binding protein [uncultured Methylobacterium sp.]|uniref:FAD/NAD(P)-binding protein n=1 Tax=uncultured Methylobacterium sp. TaxID=157278 RepID=UPI0035CB8CD6
MSADPPASGEPLRLVVVGGGFTGAVLAIHAARASAAPLDIVVLEPAAELGRGIAYGAAAPGHRMNVPSDRMDIDRARSGAATGWFRDHGILPDAESDDGTGRCYVARLAYGAYVGDLLARTVAEAGARVRVRHLRTLATGVAPMGSGWRVACDTGEVLDADRVALCLTHATPGLPCRLEPGVAEARKFVPDPWAPRALADIAADDAVLVVGTGLTMADVVTGLTAAGHAGVITAVSRRGLLPRAHGVFVTDLDVLGGPPPRTALGLLRLVRRRIRTLDPALGWHPVIDSLRAVLTAAWNALPPVEQRRTVRRLLPFWDVHRFRIAPQIEAALNRARASGQLRIKRAAVTGLARGADGFVATLRPPGGTPATHAFDAVILCTGPGRDLTASPLIATLLEAGTVRLDAAGLGLAVDPMSRAFNAAGRPQRGLHVFGPLTRGSFGEMTGAPDIAVHIEAVVHALLDDRN